MVLLLSFDYSLNQVLYKACDLTKSFADKYAFFWWNAILSGFLVFTINKIDFSLKLDGSLINLLFGIKRIMYYVHLLPLYLAIRNRYPFPKTIKNCEKLCQL